MSKCIFCSRHTNNEYSYYKSDNTRGTEREKISAFVCTKCLRKKRVIVLLSIALLFLLSMIGGISDDGSSGRQPTEGNPVATLSVMILGFLIWAGYYIICIKKDRRLDRAAERRLIRAAGKAAPELTFYTSAQHELLTPAWQRKVDRLTVMDTEMQKDVALKDSDGLVRFAAVKMIDDVDFLKKLALKDSDWQVRRAAVERITDEDFLKEVVLQESNRDVRRAAMKKIHDKTWLKEKGINRSEEKEIAVEELIRLYKAHPGGFIMRSSASEPVREIGERLAEIGGFQFMLEVHREFSYRYPELGMARNLESAWDGIGGWAG